MPLTSGTRLGPFEVLGSLGAGGMGEVYRARDSKLGRDVALKILPDHFAADPERLAPFEREAKTLASLNHPHIAQIYGFEQSDSTCALVMELVEGEDLSARIARGPIPLDEAIARQIADALEAAHEQGIIHRDLNPANIKLRSDGTVKVLDFGLAKAVEGAVALPPSGATITSAAMTMRGMILGTAAYMAPEQAKGKTVDKRADIWAFGVIRFAEAQGLLATLLQSSLAANPNNADLRALREFRFETTSTRTVGFTEPGSVARVDKVALRHAIQHAYALEELQLLCADVQERCKTLGHDVRLSLDDISGTTKPTKVLNVIEFLDRRRLLDVLVQTVREQRPGSL